MNKRVKLLILGLAAVALGLGWYWFRPEKLFTNDVVHEDFPAALKNPTPAIGLQGKFHGVFHSGTGTATVFQLPDGKRVLRFTEFNVDNGPDLYVYLVASNDASDSATVKTAGHVTLGRLKGNRGDQNYEIPTDVDAGKYRAVTIWCQRFGVNFATAPLAETRPG